MQRNKNPPRKYSFKVVSYANWEELQNLLGNAYHWACILHDRDETDPHYHILVSFKQNKSFEVVRSMVVSEQNTLVQELTDWAGDFEYLTHKNAPDKFQYMDDEVLSNDLDFWKRKAGECDKGEDDFVNDLLTGVLLYREMAVKYGRDYIRNFRSYEYFKDAVHMQERNYNED